MKLIITDSKMMFEKYVSGFQYVATNTQPTIQRVFDVNNGNVGNVNGFNNGFNNGVNNGFSSVQRDTSQKGNFVRSMLVDQRINCELFFLV